MLPACYLGLHFEKRESACEDIGPHKLIDLPQPPFSNEVLQRAFIAWNSLGQVNRFRDVCVYYKALIDLEQHFTPEQRAASADNEHQLLVSTPPTSEFLKAYFPRLYPENPVAFVYPDEICQMFELNIQAEQSRKTSKQKNRKEPLHGAYKEKNDEILIKIATNSGTNNSIGSLEGLAADNSTENIFLASQMIRKYCKFNNLTLKDFLEEFKTYAEMNDINSTVSNVIFYIANRTESDNSELPNNAEHYIANSSVQRDTTSDIKRQAIADQLKTKGIPRKEIEEFLNHLLHLKI